MREGFDNHLALPFPADSGYMELVQPIGVGMPLAILVRAQQAMTVLRLVEQAHAMAAKLALYRARAPSEAADRT